MKPSAALYVLRARARMLEQVRSFFAALGVLEVDTPQLSAAANTDPNIASFPVDVGEGAERWLHTSPEFAMKRLLAAGAGPIYQVCHVFRASEAGRMHNPEFTLLEWYRPGFDHLDLMEEVGNLAALLLGNTAPNQPPRRLTYRQAFIQYAALDPFESSETVLADALRDHDINIDGVELDRDQSLDLLMGSVVGPRLGNKQLCFVTDYPASQAALARIRPGPTDVAERFELYWQGVELANGYRELTDSIEQAQRFEADNSRRRAQGLPQLPIDKNLLAALESGLPECAGVALGLDRLLMLKLGLDRIADTLAFPWDHA